jgi:hypothetical protein
MMIYSVIVGERSEVAVSARADIDAMQRLPRPDESGLAMTDAAIGSSLVRCGDTM